MEAKKMYVVCDYWTLSNDETYIHNADAIQWKDYMQGDNKKFKRYCDAYIYCEEKFQVSTIKQSMSNVFLHEGYIILKVLIQDGNIIDFIEGDLYMINGIFSIDKD